MNHRSVVPFLAILAFTLIIPPLAHAQDQDTDQQTQDAQAKAKAKKKKERDLYKELQPVYKEWLNGPVSYIITPEERSAFLHLQTNQERENFIESFWERRNPDPGSPENTYKEEYYRRIAYANEHYSSGIPGWKTDRGRIYLMWGKPDEVDSHPAGGPYERPAAEGGGETSTYPFEDWRYRYLEGIGENVEIEFVDPTGSGEYHLTMDPSEKDALTYVPGAGLTDMEAMGMASKTDRFKNTDGTHMAEAQGGQPQSYNEFARLDLYAKIQAPPPVKFKDLEAVVDSRLTANQIQFQCHPDFLRITDDTDLVPITIQIPNHEMSFQDKNGVQIATMHLFARITSVSGRVVNTFEDTITAETPDSLMQQYLKSNSIYQKAVPLSPGLYRLDVVLKDINSSNLGVINTRLAVPRYQDDTLGTSSLILADEIRKVSSKDIGMGQFVLGDLKVRPKLDATFDQAGNMGIFLQVYNLKVDPKTHQGNATIDYQVYHEADPQPVLTLSENSQQYNQHGEEIWIEKALDLKSLPPGHYKLKIQITDNNDQQKTSPAADFTIIQAPTTAQASSK
ncbi:MAG TPA: GWxTD domain-containing protein [Candidatus Acidoferrales bacterium]|nr:GWxTD domain-containing protein [Candidatus Acidoferrales bacterium]